MKRYILLKLILLLILLLPMSCGSNVDDDQYVSALAGKIEQCLGNRLAGFSKVVVIPRRGCTGAIAEAIHYFRYGEDRENVLFVFTYNLDRKGVKNDIGDESLYAASNVFIDWENIFFIPSAQERVFPYEIIITNSSEVSKLRRFEIFPVLE